MSNKVYTVSIHQETADLSTILEGAWDQTFSDYDRAQELYTMFEEALVDNEEGYFVVLKTITVTTSEEPYSMQLYDDESETFTTETYDEAEAVANEVLDALLGELEA